MNNKTKQSKQNSKSSKKSKQFTDQILTLGNSELHDYESKTKKNKTVNKRKTPLSASVRLQSSAMRGLQPRRLPFHLKYATRFSINPGVGTAGIHVFEANGMYDPDITGVGGQPRGFDQFMLLYDHFLVTKASIDVIFGPSDVLTICGITTYDKSATLTDITDYSEQGSTVLKPNPSSQGYECRLSQTVDIAQFLSKVNLRDEKDLHGNSTNNPVEDVMFHVWAGAASSTADATALTCYAILHFYGEFNEPKDPGAS